MPFVSYAQNFEDVILWRALKHVGRGFYIDIGAQDPVIDSVSLAFYEQGWRGVHVEPVAEYAEKLRKARPDEEVIQAAVTTRQERSRLLRDPRHRPQHRQPRHRGAAQEAGLSGSRGLGLMCSPVGDPGSLSRSRHPLAQDRRRGHGRAGAPQLVSVAGAAMDRRRRKHGAEFARSRAYPRGSRFSPSSATSSSISMG